MHAGLRAAAAAAAAVHITGAKDAPNEHYIIHSAVDIR